MVKRKNEVALVDAEQNKSIREKYMKTDKVSFYIFDKDSVYFNFEFYFYVECTHF